MPNLTFLIQNTLAGLCSSPSPQEEDNKLVSSHGSPSFLTAAWCCPCKTDFPPQTPWGRAHRDGCVSLLILPRTHRTEQPEFFTVPWVALAVSCHAWGTAAPAESQSKAQSCAEAPAVAAGTQWLWDVPCPCVGSAARNSAFREVPLHSDCHFHPPAPRWHPAGWEGAAPGPQPEPVSCKQNLPWNRASLGVQDVGTISVLKEFITLLF